MWAIRLQDRRQFTLDDGSQVLFDSAESDLVALHGGASPDVLDGGKLTARLQGVAEAAEEVAVSLRCRLAGCPGLARLRRRPRLRRQRRRS